MWKKATEPRCAIFQPKECGWFVDNSRKKPILKPTFFNGDALPQTINEIFEDKANSESRTDGFLIDANDIIGDKVSNEFDFHNGTSNEDLSDDSFDD